MRLISSFSKTAVSTGSNLNGFLAEETLKAYTPSVFAKSAHPDRSERYLYIPTWEIVEALGAEGFKPVFAAQSNPRRQDKRGYTKHLIRFRRESDLMRAGWKEECPEMVLLNSHGGESQLQMFEGVIKFLCLNSQVRGDINSEVKVRHAGRMIENVVEAAVKMAGGFEKIMGEVDSWKQIRLNQDEQRAFAKGARELRCPSLPEEQRPRDWVHPIPVEEFLAVRRPGDAGGDLWTINNVVQENVIRGGLEGVRTSANGQQKRTSTRAITAVSDDIRLNRALWTLTAEMAKLKGA